MKGLCRYKNLLGKPGTGIHSFRIANIAVFDVIITLLFAYILCLHIYFLLAYSYLVLLCIEYFV